MAENGITDIDKRLEIIIVKAHEGGKEKIMQRGN